jgi:hypothetical protein
MTKVRAWACHTCSRCVMGCDLADDRNGIPVGKIWMICFSWLLESCMLNIGGFAQDHAHLLACMTVSVSRPVLLPNAKVSCRFEGFVFCPGDVTSKLRIGQSQKHAGYIREKGWSLEPQTESPETLQIDQHHATACALYCWHVQTSDP